MSTSASIRVVAAVIERGGRYLACQRPPGKHFAGLWEFPGGKVNPGESDAEALARELHEELGLTGVSVGAQLGEHTTPAGVPLFFLETRAPDEPRCLEHQDLGWFTPDELRRLPLTPGDALFVAEHLPPRSAPLDALARSLLTPTHPLVVADAESFWSELHPPARGPSTIEVAIGAGVRADRLGYAFLAGYQGALRALAPGLPWRPLASFCMTEAGGGHPRAIQARLDETDPSRPVLHGHKRWSTAAAGASVLLVVVTRGLDAQGKNRLVVAQVPGDAPGLRRVVMPPTPFVPEVTHAEVTLEGVSSFTLLPGDGYETYARPFRTIEDLHILAAASAWLCQTASRLGLGGALALEFFSLAVALRELSTHPPASPGLHLALAGLIARLDAALPGLDEPWRRSDPEGFARWERDRPLLQIAGAARQARTASARALLGG